MNGNHFDIHDLKREYEKGRKQGAVEELKLINEYLEHPQGKPFFIMEFIERRLLELEKGEIVNE